MAEEEIDQGRGEEDQAGQSVEKVRHCVEVAEPLRRAESASEERIVGAHDLDHAAGPANALLDVSAEAFGGEACGLRDVDVGGVPAVLLHSQRRVGVFGYGFDGHAADLIERGATDNRAGTAEEGGVPEVVAILHDSVEEFALVGDLAEEVEIALEGIGGIEVVGRLQHAQFGVAQEPAEGDLQEAAGGDVVTVEDGDIGCVETRKGGVDVAGLGVLVVVARHVANAGLFGESAELFAFAVVEDVDVELVGWPVDIHRGESGVLHDAERLVVGGDEEIDGGPQVGVVGQWNWRAAQRPEGLEITEEEDDEGIGFGEEQEGDEEGVEEAPDGAGIEEESAGRCESPVAVAKGGEHGDEHHRQGDQIGA